MTIHIDFLTQAYAHSMPTPLPPPDLTEVLFTARWSMPRKLAKPWVGFMHSRWDNLRTREAMSLVINSALTGPADPPAIDISLIERYDDLWCLQRSILEIALRALEDTSLTMLSQGEAAERALAAEAIRYTFRTPPMSRELAAPLDPFGV